MFDNVEKDLYNIFGDIGSEREYFLYNEIVKYFKTKNKSLTDEEINQLG
jgi:hypothetical protein